MSKMKIIFQSLEEVQDYLKIVHEYPCNMDLSKGRVIIDAKSILGILALGIKNEITLNVHSDSCFALKQALQQFIVA